MSRLSLLALLGLIVVMASGCSPSIQVNQDWDDHIDFMDYRSFKILDTRGVGDDLVARRLVNSVEVHMTERGYVVDEDNPEFLIAIHTNVEDRLDVQSWGYSASSRYWHGGSDITVRQYQEGTLILDFVQPQDMQLFWRGWGTVTVSSSTRDPAALQEIVDKILAQFPPR